MTSTRHGGDLLMAVVLAAALGVPVNAQTSVTPADVQRLQDQIYEAARDVVEVRGREPALASQLETELDEARDETIYLKVKLRKNEATSRSEYSGLRDRIESIRTRARAASSGASAPPAAGGATGVSGPSAAVLTPSSGLEVPVGTEFDVRLQGSLSSRTSRVEDRFSATTIVDLRRDEAIVIPAGSVMRGLVTSVDPAGRLDRKGSMTVVFDQITVRGESHAMRATVTQAIESAGIRGEAGRIGAGAGVGAIIGGILGGVRGALAGILIGGGGTMAATEGKDVELPAGTVLRVRLDSPLDLH